MSTLSKSEYLKRYTSDADVPHVKRKRKDIPENFRMKKSRIFDDDIDIKTLPSSFEDSTAYDNIEENIPIIAAVIDERPKHIQCLEAYKTNKWKGVTLQSVFVATVVNSIERQRSYNKREYSSTNEQEDSSTNEQEDSSTNEEGSVTGQERRTLCDSPEQESHVFSRGTCQSPRSDVQDNNFGEEKDRFSKYYETKPVENNENTEINKDSKDFLNVPSLDDSVESLLIKKYGQKGAFGNSPGLYTKSFRAVDKWHLGWLLR
uniref:Uncharacterized protein n=1 Tax=Magallana gigas TaxID=29159 RepID=A0A8W8L4L3_MAGGI